MLTRLLAHPATKGLDLDAPETTALRREIVLSKPFLRKVYDEWYDLIVERLPSAVGGSTLELGSGGGFLETRVPGLITSDVFPVPGVEPVSDARHLPFDDAELGAIVMVNVLHHIPGVEQFLSEAVRCLAPGGRIVMIEPWNTSWSQYVHERWHNELFDPDSPTWDSPESGPVSGANAALPWIVFDRDRARLESEWPDLRLLEVVPFMAWRYLASGGVSMRSLQPGWSYRGWRRLERMLGVERRMAVFALIVVERS
ncbi:MAG TPA: class I SAM-dependent methyltransferase [Acidimicrobiia bacterium]